MKFVSAVEPAAFGVAGLENFGWRTETPLSGFQLSKQDIIHDKVSIETSVYSDTWKAYRGLEEEFAEYKTVNHTDQESTCEAKGVSTGLKDYGATLKNVWFAITV